MIVEGIDVDQYLKTLKKKLLLKKNWRKIELTKEWASEFPIEAGVYVLIEDGLVVYAGESGCLRKRMFHLLRTQQHVVRRTIGKKFYSQVVGYEQATSSKPFPPHIETLINKHIRKKYLLAYMKILLGRKELEEFIVDEILLESRLNNRTKSRMLEVPAKKIKSDSI